MSSETDNWLIAVTAGTWQVHGIREAQKLGLKVLAIDSNPMADGFLFSERKLLTSFKDPEFVLKYLEEEKINIVGAVSFCSEAGMDLASRIRAHFGLTGCDLELSSRLLDKGIQRTVWSKHNIPGPRWLLCLNIEEARLCQSKIPYPYIVKPTDSSGSRGVTKIESEKDNFERALDQAFYFSRSGKVIIEEYMAGTEFTLETFSIAGITHVLAVTEKKKVAGTNGTVANELATPNRPHEVIDKMKGIVKDALAVLGYKDGPGHSEVILMSDGKIGVVEVAGRGGGFMVFDRFVPMVSGVNIARLTAQQGAGMPVELPELRKKSGVLRFFPSRPGKLIKITGMEEARLLEGVEVGVFAKVGDVFNQAVADGDRLGYILTSAVSSEDAQGLADKAESLIHFEIK